MGDARQVEVARQVVVVGRVGVEMVGSVEVVIGRLRMEAVAV